MWYYYWHLKTSAYIPTFTVPCLTLCNVPLAACSMQHDSQTALQSVYAIGKSNTDHTLQYIHMVTWTAYTLASQLPSLCFAHGCYYDVRIANRDIVLSQSHRAVSLGIYHGWWLALAYVLTATLKSLPWEGLLSCHIDDALSYQNYSMSLVILILKKNIFQALYGA